MIEDQQLFYDKESVQYSKKRYEGDLLSYTQYIFRRRCTLFIGYMKKIAAQEKPVSVFEIGCADGVIFKNMAPVLGSAVTQMVGVDVSSGMIKEAALQNPDKKMSFFLRGEEPAAKYDVVVELGVHIEKLSDEIAYVKTRLAVGGYFIYSAASPNTLFTKIKMRGKEYVKDYLTYEETEKILAEHFEIIASEPYGFFVPKLWAVPSVGRTLQPFFDALVKYILPDLFHEKVYLLKRTKE